MAGWYLKRLPELVPHFVEDKQYRRELAEIARLMYFYFRQSDSPSRSIGPELPNAKEFRT